MAGDLGRAARVRGDRGVEPTEVLLPRDVPVPVGKDPHGSRAELLHRGRGGAVPHDAGVQGPPSHGVGRVRLSCRERRLRARRPPGQMDPGQHRLHEVAAPEHGLLVRLDAGGHVLRAGVLPVESVVFPQDAGARLGLPEDGTGQLVRALPVGPQQRAGGGRGLLAAHGHAGGAARAGTMVSPDHGIRRGAAP